MEEAHRREAAYNLPESKKLSFSRQLSEEGFLLLPLFRSAMYFAHLRNSASSNRVSFTN
jgi:hypothetical protein